MFKFIVSSFSFNRGGAGIAAHKFVLLAKNYLSITVEPLSQDNAGRVQFIKRLISYALAKLQFDGNPIKHSLNLFSYRPVLNSFRKQTNAIHHLHWINNDTLSVFDFDLIPSGSIITLHDEWLYCGVEHCYKVLDNSDDFIHGYNFFKKGVYGVHWNFIIWSIKKQKIASRTDLIITVPSKWMQERAKKSLILKGMDIRYLPNPIDVDVFKPASQDNINAFKQLHGIEPSAVLLCFGAIGGKSNYLKGAHLLEQALSILQNGLCEEKRRDIVLIDFGGKISSGELLGFRSISLGHISGPDTLATVYSAVDCVIVPSMVESFGQVAAEALACSTPVVCFDTSGLKDIVLHDQTGLVSDAFSPASLASNLTKVVNMTTDEKKTLGKKGRLHVESNFSFPIVAKQYKLIIDDAVELKQSVKK